MPLALPSWGILFSATVVVVPPAEHAFSLASGGLRSLGGSLQQSGTIAAVAAGVALSALTGLAILARPCSDLEISACTA